MLVCVCVCARATSICVRENLYLHFLNFSCVCVQQGRHIAHKFESGWEVGVINTLDKKGPHAGKVSVKYKDDQNWWTHSLCVRVMEKTSTGFCFGSSAVIPLEVTYDCSRRRPDFLFCSFIEVPVHLIQLRCRAWILLATADARVLMQSQCPLPCGMPVTVPWPPRRLARKMVKTPRPTRITHTDTNLHVLFD